MFQSNDQMASEGESASTGIMEKPPWKKAISASLIESSIGLHTDKGIKNESLPFEMTQKDTYTQAQYAHGS